VLNHVVDVDSPTDMFRLEFAAPSRPEFAGPSRA
jgi:hypothetical protein